MKHSRHTFATDMIRAGISLPALMHLMGHAQIQTTMVYVRITPQDVYQQYIRAVAQLVRPTPPSHAGSGSASHSCIRWLKCSSPPLGR
jgi:hypothetical protein